MNIDDVATLDPAQLTTPELLDVISSITAIEVGTTEGTGGPSYVYSAVLSHQQSSAHVAWAAISQGIEKVRKLAMDEYHAIPNTVGRDEFFRQLDAKSGDAFDRRNALNTLADTLSDLRRRWKSADPSLSSDYR